MTGGLGGLGVVPGLDGEVPDGVVPEQRAHAARVDEAAQRGLSASAKASSGSASACHGAGSVMGNPGPS